MVQAVYENYKNNPSKFVNHVNSYGLNKKLNMDFEGGRQPVIPQPSDKNWSNISSLDGLRLWSLSNANKPWHFIMLLPIMGYW
jgi:hypothetical protein